MQLQHPCAILRLCVLGWPTADKLWVQVNTEIVNCQKVVSQAGQKQLQQMLQKHVSATGSRLGQSLLDSWEVSTTITSTANRDVLLHTREALVATLFSLQCWQYMLD